MASLPTPAGFMGGMLIGICVALILYGLVTAQTYIYMLTANTDSRSMRLLVFAIWLLETVHTIMLILIAYHYTITCFGLPDQLFLITWSVGTGFIVELVIIGLVQCFYIRRVWIMSHKSYILTGFSCLLLLGRVGLGCGSAVLLYTLGEWVAFHAQEGPRATITGALVFAVAMDSTITASLVYYLRRGQSATVFSNTQNIIRSCMVYIVNTGALTVIASLLIIIMYFAEQNSIFFVGFTVIAGKLYANSMMGTLNARQLLRQKSDHVKLSEGDYVSSLQFQLGSNQPRAYPPSKPAGSQLQVFSEASKTIDVNNTLNTHTFVEDRSMDDSRA